MTKDREQEEFERIMFDHERLRDEPDFDHEAYGPPPAKRSKAEILARAVANVVAATDAQADPGKAARVEQELAAYREHMREVSACRSHHTPLEFAVIAWHTEPWRRLTVMRRGTFDIWRDQFKNFWIAADAPDQPWGLAIVINHLLCAGFTEAEIWEALDIIPEVRDCPTGPWTVALLEHVGGAMQ